MWSTVPDNGNKNNHSSRVISSSSSSRTHSSSSSSSMFPQTPRRTTMEEVWKDITLATLNHERRITPPFSVEHQHHSHHHHHHHHRPNPTTSPSFRSMILQDFLAGASKESPAIPSSAAVETMPLPLPLPPTALSLNSGIEFHDTEIHPANTHPNTAPNSDSQHAHHQADRNSDDHSGPFVSLAFPDAIIGSPPPAGLFSFCPKKRAVESPGTGGGDGRHKRMIKNRESAARSRARKQAYTNELELEVAHLAEENARLKRQYEELRLAMAAQLHTKKTLQRTSTAPF